jgi:hypothetical protein
MIPATQAGHLSLQHDTYSGTRFYRSILVAAWRGSQLNRSPVLLCNDVNFPERLFARPVLESLGGSG